MREWGQGGRALSSPAGEERIRVRDSAQLRKLSPGEGRVRAGCRFNPHALASDQLPILPTA